jgi:hypothetical protein
LKEKKKQGQLLSLALALIHNKLKLKLSPRFMRSRRAAPLLAPSLVFTPRRFA